MHIRITLCPPFLRYFPNCRYQDSCPYKHDSSEVYQVCTFFLRGNCRFGDDCR